MQILISNASRPVQELGGKTSGKHTVYQSHLCMWPTLLFKATYE